MENQVKFRLGSFADNWSAYLSAQLAWQQGKNEEALEIWQALEQHIIQHRELKSQHWLLPEVQKLLEETSVGVF